eukprot:jgi/Hompol1/4526/HPOL_000939-RA
MKLLVRGMSAWITIIVAVVLLRFGFSVLPGISAEASWTLTNITYNVITFYMFHWMLGTPFIYNQNEYDGLTLWEQIDGGAQFTATKKFLTAVPVFLFLIGTHYAHYDLPTFMINFAALMVSLIGKLPAMHKVRLFGLNKRDID